MKNNKFFILLLSIILLLAMLTPTAAFAETVQTNLRFTDSDLQSGVYSTKYLPEYVTCDMDVWATNNNTRNYPIKYQWYKDGKMIDDATDGYYGAEILSKDDYGTYTCIITDGVETLKYGMYIFQKPGNGYLRFSEHNSVGYSEMIKEAEGTEIVMNAKATNKNFDEPCNPIEYSWYKDGTIIPGATAETYTIPSLSLSDVGEYCCVVTDSERTIQYSADVSIDVQLVFEKWHESIQIRKEDLKKDLVFEGKAHNIDPVKYPITYTWTKDWDGEPIPGATGNTLTLSNVSKDDFGLYVCNATSAGNTRQMTFAVKGFFFLEETDMLQDGGERIHALPGDKIVLDAEAYSIDGNVTYEWYKDGELISTQSALTLNSFTESDYGSYECIATCNEESIYKYFYTCAAVTSFEIEDITVVPGEKFVIEGEGKTYLLNENDYIEIRCMKVDDYDNVIFDAVEDLEAIGIQIDESDEIREDKIVRKKLKWTIENTTKLIDGHYKIYSLSSDDRSAPVQFDIHVKDYEQAELVFTDGTALEGTLHPGAKLNMRPLQNHVENYFKQQMPEDAEIIWSNDVTLEIYGIADTHKGELTLHIPVNKKYNGQRLTVYHYINDSEIEELEGLVTDGVLTITAESLSPFAVIAEGDSDDSDLQDPPPGGTWFGHWKNWGGSQ